MQKIQDFLNEQKEKNITTLLKTKWFSIVEVAFDGAIMSGIWKDDRNAVVLPYITNASEIEGTDDVKIEISKVGVRYELNPLKENNYTYTAITGNIEGSETDLDGAKRELLEESGYDVSDDKRWIYLGEITTSKLTNEKHPCFAVNINNIEQGEIIGDGSVNEQKSKFELIDPEKIFDLEDTFLNTTLLKLLKKLGVF